MKKKTKKVKKTAKKKASSKPYKVKKPDIKPCTMEEMMVENFGPKGSKKREVAERKIRRHAATLLERNKKKEMWEGRGASGITYKGV